MTDIVIVAIIAAVPATLGVLVSLKNGHKLHIIHDTVNGGLKAAKEKIKTLEAENSILKEQLGISSLY